MPRVLCIYIQCAGADLKGIVRVSVIKIDSALQNFFFAFYILFSLAMVAPRLNGIET